MRTLTPDEPNSRTLTLDELNQIVACVEGFRPVRLALWFQKQAGLTHGVPGKGKSVFFLGASGVVMATERFASIDRMGFETAIRESLQACLVVSRR